jgi:hypothetical protein
MPPGGIGGASLYWCMLRATTQSGSHAVTFIISVVCQGTRSWRSGIGIAGSGSF